MTGIITPLISVFGIMLAGSLVQKSKILPDGTDAALNQYVYYIAFPAIMMIVLARTSFEEIFQWHFIVGFSVAMMLTYLLVLLISGCFRAGQGIGAIRALNATFGNTAFIGIPMMMIVYPGNQLALAAAAIASLLSVVMFAVALVSLELARDTENKAHPLLIIVEALAKNPIVIGSALGVAVSASGMALPYGIEMMISQIGATSSPCALFAIGMVLAKATRVRGATRLPGPWQLAELFGINACKLLLQPLLAYLLLKAMGISGTNLQMGVILAALPTAASVYLLAQRYDTKAGVSAQGILVGTLITFISLPLIAAWAV
ncbi:AEC family transporter [Shewanella algae]|uniref:AEC family transporter n=1 Tax=Shewanella algae TaxID=38313 RepID=UPI000BB64DA2|nr:AEC family transporter [Shewanella algae]PBQ25287.1 transporter [Shewanella algae]QNH99732.1 AEC family transporter [Shewanella algae]